MFIPKAYTSFVRVVEEKSKINNRGYVLGKCDNYPSVIILRKGGNTSMIKTVEKVKEGYEKIYEDIVEYEKTLEEKIRKQMEDDLNRVKALKEQCVEIVEVEIPDEEEQEENVVETTENI